MKTERVCDLHARVLQSVYNPYQRKKYSYNLLFSFVLFSVQHIEVMRFVFQLSVTGSISHRQQNIHQHTHHTSRRTTSPKPEAGASRRGLCSVSETQTRVQRNTLLPTQNTRHANRSWGYFKRGRRRRGTPSEYKWENRDRQTDSHIHRPTPTDT